MHARRAQASKLVSLKVDDVTAYGDKLFLPDTPLDMDALHAYLRVHDTETGDHEGKAAVTSEFVDKLVSIAAQSDIMSASSPFEDLRELGCQTEVAFIEKCICWSALQVHGCRAALAARHLLESASNSSAQETWFTVAKETLQKLRLFAAALQNIIQDTGNLDETVSCQELLAAVAEQPPWDNIVQGSVIASAEHRECYQEVFQVCLTAFQHECSKDLEKAMKQLKDCIPDQHEAKIGNLDEEAPWIREHIFGNPHHKLINARKDLLRVRIGFFEGIGGEVMQDVGGRATSVSLECQVDKLEDAEKQWEAAHNYLGVASVLNCILNRPVEAGMTAAELQKHVSKTKVALQRKSMSVPDALITRLEEVPQRFLDASAA